MTYEESLRRCYERHGLTELQGMSDSEVQELMSDPGYNPYDPPERGICRENPTYTDW